jgi:hypothetical protein
MIQFDRVIMLYCVLTEEEATVILLGEVRIRRRNATETVKSQNMSGPMKYQNQSWK